MAQNNKSRSERRNERIIANNDAAAVLTVEAFEPLVGKPTRADFIALPASKGKTRRDNKSHRHDYHDPAERATRRASRQQHRPDAMGW